MGDLWRSLRPIVLQVGIIDLGWDYGTVSAPRLASQRATASAEALLLLAGAESGEGLKESARNEHALVGCHARTESI